MNASRKTRLAVTGASGFIARGILDTLGKQVQLRAFSRSQAPVWVEDRIDWIPLKDYTDSVALSRGLEGVDYVLHLADNRSRNQGRDRSAALQVADVLIDAMQRNSVKGAIIASSIYARDSNDLSNNSYGAVKAAIERKFLAATTLQTIILRMPPVYGPGGGGGIAMLAKLAKSRLPLPLGLARAPRAYLSRQNLVALISCLIQADEATWKKADGSIFEPSDGFSVSTNDLVRFMANRLGVTAITVPIPLGLLRAVGVLTGQSAAVASAIDPLEVSAPEELEAAFGWRPVEHMPESLAFLKQEFSPV